MDAKELQHIIMIIQKAEITAKNFRQCTMSIWQKSLRNVRGFGQHMYGICLILDVMQEMKVVSKDVTTKVL